MELVLLVLVLLVAAALMLASTVPGAQWNSEGLRDHETTRTSPRTLYWPRPDPAPP